MTASTRGTHHAYARLVLETMPEESRLGLTLGFIRTFGIPDIARVLHGTGRMTGEPRARAKATGVAMFTLIGQGLESPEGRRTVDALRRIHDRPDITPELMHYVLACFTVCPLRFIDTHGHRPVAEEERKAAYAFHLGLSDALDLPGLPGGAGPGGGGPGGGGPDGGDLDGVERWMRDYEVRHFAPTEEARALWHSASHGLLAARLPSALAPLAPAVAASLLDAPLGRALRVRRPPAPVRALVIHALRSRARDRARTGRGTG
ncbi:oxygenase MpaB family protein [Streptomyces lushanensis]|uniref:oxygenase MpaB family protein n=1 Tax=Streptomyces lushanensis TaxID=1434255 RepID=UPI0009A007D3|nr:oxygenase MpaB family protein [Streptomyces lushanensis]